MSEHSQRYVGAGCRHVGSGHAPHHRGTRDGDASCPGASRSDQAAGRGTELGEDRPRDGEQYDDVQLACDHRRPWRGVTVCEEGLDPREVLVVDGVPVTDPVRSVVFLMRYATRTRGRPRRSTCGCCGSSAPDCHDRSNMPIFTLGGRHIGTPDLLDPVSGVLGEYDGGLHLAGDRRARDIRREAVFREHGLEPVTMVAEDRIDNRAFLDRLRAAYRRARRRLTSDRNWTVVPPPWWGYDAHRQAGVRG